MARSREKFVEAALDLAWSHWTGLGVRGTVIPAETAVDPEALVYLTASLVEDDPRLREEVIDWWSRFEHHVSRPRLARLANQFEPTTVAKFNLLKDELESPSRLSGKSRLDGLDHPARALLRLRCIFGANARAEVLHALLTQWANSADGVTASMLAEVGYSKRNVVLVLDDLRLAGLVLTSVDTNRVRYRLANATALRNVVGPLSRVSGRWHLRLPIVAAFVELCRRIREKDIMIQAVEAKALLQRYEKQIDLFGLPGARLGAPAVLWEQLQEWLMGSLMRLPADDSRSLNGELEGAWAPGEQEVSWRPEPFSSAVLPSLGTDLASETEMICLDLARVDTVSPPNEWEWAVLSDVALHTYDHLIGMKRGDPWRFHAWVSGRLKVYKAELAPALPPSQIARRYGDAASRHARKDRPALQLKLTLDTEF